MKQPYYKRWWVWVIVGVLVVGVLNAIINDEDSDIVADDAEPVVAAPDDNGEMDVEDAEAPEVVPVWPDVELTEEAIESALTGVKGTGVIAYDDDTAREISLVPHAVLGGYIAYVKINPGAVWNEKTLVDRIGRTHAAYAQRLFEHPEITEINLWGQADFRDEYGNSNEQTAVRIAWSRDTHEKVNYENFLRNHASAYNIADSYFIHRGVFNAMKDEDRQEFRNGQSK